MTLPFRSECFCMLNKLLCSFHIMHMHCLYYFFFYNNWTTIPPSNIELSISLYIWIFDLLSSLKEGKLICYVLILRLRGKKYFDYLVMVITIYIVILRCFIWRISFRKIILEPKFNLIELVLVITKSIYMVHIIFCISLITKTR